MKTLTLNAWGEDHQVYFWTDSYAENGNLYVGIAYLENGMPEPWSDLTVNLSVKCAENCAYIDTNNNSDGIIKWLVDNKLGHLTGDIECSGFCIYPEFEFNMDKLKEYIGEL